MESKLETSENGPSETSTGQREKDSIESKDVTDLISDDEDDDPTASIESFINGTPAIIKRQQILKQSKWFKSPTDNIQSPCSQKLIKRHTHHKLLVNRLKLDQMKD